MSNSFPEKHNSKTFPSVPPPVKLELPARKSVLLILDATVESLKRQSFKDSIPILKRLIEKARLSGVRIIYTMTRTLGVDIVEEIAPSSDDFVLETYGADKFYNTKLEDLLLRWEIKYPVIAGTAANGAVMYTAFEAIMRGYSVIVVEDGISADSEEIYRFALWQLLNSPGRRNPDNKPLAPLAVTLTKEELLNFR